VLVRSLAVEPESRYAKVSMFDEPRIAALEALGDDVAFALTAVVQHGSNSPYALGEVTNLPDDLCRSAVSLCLDRGYVVRAGDGRIEVSVHWWAPMIRYLRRKHFLYQ
jgi:hypothetical protein